MGALRLLQNQAVCALAAVRIQYWLQQQLEQHCPAAITSLQAALSPHRMLLLRRRQQSLQ
jgi:hypothetical protein